MEWFPGEVAMGPVEYLLSPPVLYLLIVWGIATIIFIVLMIWRSLLSSHEDDQIFLNPAEEMMEKEQKELVGKIDMLSRPLMTSGITSGVLLLVMAGMVVYHGLKTF
jgi:hypothetical protein